MRPSATRSGPPQAYRTRNTLTFHGLLLTISLPTMMMRTRARAVVGRCEDLVLDTSPVGGSREYDMGAGRPRQRGRRQPHRPCSTREALQRAGPPPGNTVTPVEAVCEQTCSGPSAHTSSAPPSVKTPTTQDGGAVTRRGPTQRQRATPNAPVPGDGRSASHGDRSACTSAWTAVGWRRRAPRDDRPRMAA